MEINDQKVLVTGGAGFIGSSMSEALLRLGAEVTVVDNFDDFYSGKEKNIEGLRLNKRFKLIRGSILDQDLLLSANKGVDLVVHLAGQAGIRYCNERPSKANEVNATGTMNVLVAARQRQVKKVVYASSSSVYGDPVKTPIREDHPTEPSSPYGASKLAGEKYCTSFVKTYDMDITCLRYFSVYGPRGRPDQILYSFAQKVANGGAPVIYGDGSYSRDFTYVSDVVSATLMAVIHEESRGRVINVGYGKDFKVIEVARRIIDRFGLDIQPVFKESYGGDFSRTLCDNSLARQVLKWTPEIKFEDGLPRFLDWFDEHHNSATTRTDEATFPKSPEHPEL
ncbi:MAG: NAD-dependent epimerase/dehydratase family protein [Thaumarchaeota archaeon]|nr:NAD-dependent epimerase/dehydratase family protein [Nitrososphaerota archaeon]